MPEEPADVKAKKSEFVNNKLPHFFIYAKDKEDNQVEEVNGSFVNKLNSLIPNPAIRKKSLQKSNSGNIFLRPNYSLLMNNKDIAYNIIDDIVAMKNLEIVDVYSQVAKTCYMKIDALSKYDLRGDILTKSAIKQNIMYKQVIADLDEGFSALGIDMDYIMDYLITYLYDFKLSGHKDLLWIYFGNKMLENLKGNIRRSKKEIQCTECGVWFRASSFNNRGSKCEECYKVYRREYKRAFIANKRAKQKEANDAVDSTK